MDVFTHQDNRFISINGKDYFLVRGYRRNHRNFIFIQVHGKTPLRKEDLPSKDWEIITSKVGGKKVWTAFVKRYFSYDSRRDNPTFAFIGASTKGSFFLALSHIAKRFCVQVGADAIDRFAELYSEDKLNSHHFERVKDDGTSGAEMVLVSFDSFFDDARAKSIFEEVTSHE